MSQAGRELAQHVIALTGSLFFPYLWLGPGTQAAWAWSLWGR